MWKNKLSKDNAINIINDKRKCVDINIGFLYQLSKWEELLKNDKMKKIYKFEESGNLIIIDYNENKDINTTNKICFSNESFILLLFHKNKFYVIINSVYLNENTELNNKLNNFIYLLQTYENYPKEIEIINSDVNKKENIETINKKKLFVN
jgi:hypothetical protein